MKFLWESNSPWSGTGYGQQTKMLLSALKQLGHEPQCFCFYGLSGGCIEYDGYTCWPNSDYNTWGNDVIKLHTERSGSQAVITLMDLFVLEEKVWSELAVPWLAWIPIDSIGIGSMNEKLMKVASHPVAMSQFGAEQMRNYDVEPADMIWHAVDCNVYHPMDKAECRSLLQLDQDAWVIGMVMANKGDRKQYPLQLTAIKQLADKNPDRKIQVYIHTEPTSAMGGWDMRELVKKVGLTGQVYATNQYDTSVVPAPPQFVAQIYNACDVVMNVSAGEGFGIPIVEAQACGVPVLTGDYTAMTELTHLGYCITPQGKGLGGHFGWQFMPNVEEMVYRLECFLFGTDASLPTKDETILWVKRNFDVPVIARQWDLLLQKVEAELNERISSNRMEYV